MRSSISTRSFKNLASTLQPQLCAQTSEINKMQAGGNEGLKWEAMDLCKPYFQWAFAGMQFVDALRRQYITLSSSTHRRCPKVTDKESRENCTVYWMKKHHRKCKKKKKDQPKSVKRKRKTNQKFIRDPKGQGRGHSSVWAVGAIKWQGDHLEWMCTWGQLQGNLEP